MKIVTIAIQTATESVQVKAKAIGDWAYHRVHPPGEPGYAVTHVPTGRQVTGMSGCSEHAAHATVHRVAAMCLHGLEQVPDDIEPMDSAILQERAWLMWWRTLSPWARASLARACEARIREMLDDPRRPVQWWLKHFATYDWRGKQYGYAIRPIVGKKKRACLDVFVGQWIDPESSVVAAAERLLAQANETRASQGEPAWPWVQFRLTA